MATPQTPQPPQKPAPPPPPPPRSDPPPKKDSKDAVTPFAGSPLTVTVANPTPPTNFAYNVYGTPPSPASMTFVDDGTAGAITAIATPLSTVAPQGVAAEATGTVLINNTQPLAVSISTGLPYTTTPNASHPSSQSPGTVTITSLVPASTAGTGGTMNLTVNGTLFEEMSVVYINGVPNATNYISTTQLQAVNAPKKTSAGTWPVTVVTGGVASAPATWTFV